ncbi:MAG: CheR family methyltransferase [Rickettsiales bacterium]
MKPEEFKFLSDLLKQRSGLTLTDDKAYLIESRLTPIARAQGLADISALCQQMKMSPKEDLLVEITEAMTTNESSFFRDIKPYNALREIVLPEIIKKPGEKKIRIWSAACSTGQEPYSIAICLEEDKAKMPGWSFEIVASDLAQKVVDKAIKGAYSQFEAQRGLPIQMLMKYFASQPDTTWQIKDNIKSMVKFQTHNLLHNYGTLGRFDIVFCRNVLIYFDDPIRGAITEKMAGLLPKDGVLVIGSTESLVDPKKQFKALDGFRGAYKKL